MTALQIKGIEYRRTEDYENSRCRGFVVYNSKTDVEAYCGEIFLTLFSAERKFREACGLAELFGYQAGDIEIAEVVELQNGNMVKVQYPIRKLTGVGGLVG